MYRVRLDEIELEYEIRGTGELVVLVHHGAGADWFNPILDEPALTDRFRLLLYHRPGYAGSGPLKPPLTFTGETLVLRALLDRLGVERAHILGHSASACIALQMALDGPTWVHSVALLEAALLAVPSPPEVPRALELYRAGERTTAVETFLRGTCGPNHGAVLEARVPGAVARAVADADTFFRHELPALRQWTFGPDEGARVAQPVLAVVGDESDARFHQRHQLLLDWLPHVEEFVLPHAGHLLYLDNHRDFVAGLSAFLQRHPIAIAT